MKEIYSKLLSKVPFLWIFLGLGLIGSVLFKISGYNLVTKKFPVEYFIWGFFFALTLALFIKFIPNISPIISKILSGFWAIYVTILFVFLSLSFLYKELKPIFTDTEIEKEEGENNLVDSLAIEKLVTQRREINFNYEYKSTIPATVSASLIPRDKKLPEYPGLVLGSKIIKGVNKVSINFNTLNWDYLDNSEIDIIIRLFLSEYGGDEKIIEELNYVEKNGTQQTTKLQHD